MKIALILPSLANLGPIIIARYLVRQLAKTEEVEVFYFDDHIELEFPVRTHKISFFKPIKFEEFDIVHSHMLRPDLYVAFHSRKIPKSTKTVTTIHQESFKALQMEYNTFVAFFTIKIWNYALKNFSSVVALNRSIGDRLPVKKEKISIIGNGISVPTEVAIEHEEKMQLEKFKKKYKTVLGSSSLLIKRKGLDQVIRILNKFPKVGYVIIGDGPEKTNLRKLATELNVIDQCLFLGQKLNGYRYFSYFDVYMLPSHSEGFPICAIEAAQSKLPIVLSNIDVLQEIFSKDEVSFFDLGCSASLEKGIKVALNSYLSLSKTIFKKYQNELSDIKMSVKYLDLYQRLYHPVNSNIQ